MRTIEIKDRAITVDGRTLRASWSDEVAEDLKQYHGVDVAPELAMALLHEIDFELRAAGEPLTDEEREYCKTELLETFK